MRILTAAQMREADRLTVDGAFATSLQLMEVAGAAVCQAATELYPQAQRFVAICGKGNNGGDGLAAARKLAQRGKEVSVLLCGLPAELSQDAAAMLAKLKLAELNQTGCTIIHFIHAESGLEQPEVKAALVGADVILDALLGTGTKLPVRGFYRALIEAINVLTAPVVAVDLPSGADADVQTEGEQVDASAVVTFTALKRWHAWYPGSDLPTAIADIGTPGKLIDEIAGETPQLFTVRDLPSTFFVRPADSNKGKYGHILIVAGSLGKAGAPAMAALAALRSGAGLVTVACPGSVLSTVAGFAPEVMTEPLSGPDRDVDYVTERALDAVHKLIENKSVLALGPGLGRVSETEAFVRALIAEAELPIVLDADGLNAFAGKSELLKQHRSKLLVLTPHPGEMSRLTGLTIKEIQADRTGIASRFAREHHCVIVLKGWRSVIAFPDGALWISPTGNPGMSKGGTGDVLTGIVAAMLGQHPDDSRRAILAAVYLHGLAGDLALPEFGVQGMLATDLIASIPQAIKAMLRPDRYHLTWLHWTPPE